MQLYAKRRYNEAIDNLIDMFKEHNTQRFSKKTLDFLREFYNNNVIEPVTFSYAKNGTELCIQCKKSSRELKVYIGQEEICYIIKYYSQVESVTESGKIKNNINTVIQRLANCINKADTLDKFTDIADYNPVEIKKEEIA